jgi:RNA polymerase sigma-70 factor (sigma-E family)
MTLVQSAMPMTGMGGGAVRQARIERRAPGRGRGGQEEEFTAFYQQHAPRIVRTVAVVVRDAALAEDAVAEAFARAWGRWGKVRDHASPAAWVTRVALNVCTDRFRRRRVERRRAHALARADHVDDPEPPASYVWEAVARLPERERTLIALRYVADLPQAAISDVLGIPPGTVASGLNRGRQRLGIDLRPDLDEELS